MTSCHQARSAWSTPARARRAARTSRPAPAGRRSRPGRRRSPRSGRRRAPASAPAPSRRLRSTATHRDRRRPRRGSRGRRRRRAGRTEKTCEAAAPRQRRRRRLADRPLGQRSVSSSTSSRSSPRTRMWSSSPSRSSVEPRGGIAWPSRTITLTSASRGRSEFAHPVPGRGGARAAAGRRHVAAHAADPARLEQPPRQRRLVGGQPEPASPAARSSRPGPGSR